MPNTYQAERQSAKADIEAAGCPAKVLNRGTAVTSPCSVLILTYSTFERLSGAVADKDAKMMLPALGVPDIDPEVHDIVIDDTNPIYAPVVGTYQIVNPNPFVIGGPAIYYELQVRKR